MEKLYIATSTLNFNNILATESISPESFYLDRDFGYKRFTKVEPNPFSNSIIAYSQLPVFKIKESDLEDYPMVIEISSELIDKATIGNIIKKKGIEIFQINKTIYLHPSKTKFIFFNEKGKNMALMKAKPSIETKLIPVYRNRFEIIKNDYKTFQWNKTFLENIQDLSNDKIQESIQYDLMINKIKGFYYSYFLGAIHPLSKKEESIKNEINSISNLLLKLSNSQKIFSNSVIDELDNAVDKLRKISLAIKKESDYKEIKFISQIAEISLNGLKITQLTDVFFKDNEAEIYRSIINEILEEQISDIQKFQEKRIDLAYKIGSVLKDYHSDWDNSKEREYLNSLMDNIESYKPFNLKSHPSILLQSIALFILKGDEADKLIENLSKNQIIDYRIALGLWGSIFGFSALPKTLTDILFDPVNINVTRLLYQDIQAKLHNIISEEKIIFEKENELNNTSAEEPSDKEDIENKKKGIINENYSKTSQKGVPRCPMCGADMVRKTVKKGKYQGYEFWGCINYKPNGKGCIGKRDLQLNELDKNFKPILKDKDEKYAELIYECVKLKRHCKIKPDIIDYVFEKMGTKLQNKMIKSIVNEKLKDKLEYKKIGRADAYKIREKGMF